MKKRYNRSVLGQKAVIMSDSIDLRELERKTLHTYLQDGLLDIILGVQLILLSLFLYNRSLFFVVMWTPLALGGLEVFRKRLIYPRVGYVKLPQPARLVIKVLIACLLGMAVCLGIAVLGRLVLGLPLYGQLRGTCGFAAGVFITAVYCFLAYRFKAHRWFVYGMLLVPVFMIANRLDEPALVAGLGAVVVMVGLVVLVGFLRRYPAEGVVDGFG
jgi:hypothetical protein